MRRVLLRLLAAALLAAFAPTHLRAAEELTVTATREGKQEVLLLLENRIIMLAKWPLRAYVFDTGELEGCSLSYSVDIIDLEQVKVKHDGEGAMVVCGRTRADGRAATSLEVSSGAPVTGRAAWRVTADGDLLRVHRLVPGEREWTATMRRP